MNKEDMKELIELLNEAEGNNEGATVQINWNLIFTKLWRSRRFILCVTGICFLIGLTFALTMKRTYRVDVLLAPELNTSSKTGGLGNIASMLGVGGIGAGNSSDAYSITTYPEVIASTPFITDLFGIRVEDPKKGIDMTLADYMTRDKGFSIAKLFGKTQSKKKENLIKVDVFRLTKKQEALRGAITRCIKSNVDSKTGETTITVTMDNPVIAAIVADSVCKKLQKYITKYRTQKAQDDLEYYQKLANESKAEYEKASNAYAYYRDHNRSLNLSIIETEGTRLQHEQNIAAQVYSQMKQQAEMARAKVQEQKPVFAVIEPARVPTRATNSRKIPIIFWTAFGFAISCLWLLLVKENLNRAYRILKNSKK